MTRKTWTWLAIVIVLGGLSLYINRDWFAGENIHIYHRSRPGSVSSTRGRKNPNDNPAINPILFGFDQRLKLTSIKVVPAVEFETNKYAHAIWHLISESNSAPVKDFSYGARIQGMHPAIKGASPTPLEPGVKYLLLVETASQKAVHDFTPVTRSQ